MAWSSIFKCQNYILGVIPLLNQGLFFSHEIISFLFFVLAHVFPFSFRFCALWYSSGRSMWKKNSTFPCLGQQMLTLNQCQITHSFIYRLWDFFYPIRHLLPPSSGRYGTHLVFLVFMLDFNLKLALLWTHSHCFSQWLNQSHNACVNYCNRNATKVWCN